MISLLRKFLVISAVCLSTAALALDKPFISATSNAAAYQSCFKNTTWVVPPQTLLAYLYSNATLTPATDQTVWVFSNYNQGYFSGISYMAINNSILSHQIRCELSFLT